MIASLGACPLNHETAPLKEQPSAGVRGPGTSIIYGPPDGHLHSISLAVNTMWAGDRPLFVGLWKYSLTGSLLPEETLVCRIIKPSKCVGRHLRAL